MSYSYGQQQQGQQGQQGYGQYSGYAQQDTQQVRQAPVDAGVLARPRFWYPALSTDHTDIVQQHDLHSVGVLLRRRLLSTVSGGLATRALRSLRKGMTMLAKGRQANRLLAVSATNPISPPTLQLSSSTSRDMGVRASRQRAMGPSRAATVLTAASKARQQVQRHRATVRLQLDMPHSLQRLPQAHSMMLRAMHLRRRPLQHMGRPRTRCACMCEFMTPWTADCQICHRSVRVAETCTSACCAVSRRPVHIAGMMGR